VDAEIGSDSPLPRTTPTRPERFLFWTAGVGVVLLALLVTAASFVRWIGIGTIPDSVLLVQEVMVGVIILPLAYVSAARGHIAVTIFTRRIGVRGELALSVLGSFAGLLFVVLLAVGGWILFDDAVVTGAYHDGDLNLPKWIARAVYVLGLAAFALRLTWLLLLDLRAALRGTPAAPPG
jgi:TRAP-type C4-dicarboxylate transport system permease small subunit